mmetsp:Transcript_1894/g.3011  ORF Transcript_1894/g.3011 Transcript_1894/m.3011 type:complete len:229 (-) Transcript_1894:544-1230(-)
MLFIEGIHSCLANTTMAYMYYSLITLLYRHLSRSQVTMSLNTSDDSGSYSPTTRLCHAPGYILSVLSSEEHFSNNVIEFLWHVTWSASPCCISTGCLSSCIREAISSVAFIIATAVPSLGFMRYTREHFNARAKTSGFLKHFSGIDGTGVIGARGKILAKAFKMSVRIFGGCILSAILTIGATIITPSMTFLAGHLVQILNAIAPPIELPYKKNGLDLNIFRLACSII